MKIRNDRFRHFVDGKVTSVCTEDHCSICDKLFEVFKAFEAYQKEIDYCNRVSENNEGLFVTLE